MRATLLHRSNCESSNPTNTITSRLNTLLNSSGQGYTLSLCAGEVYPLSSPLLFTAPNQEISTAGYPTDSTRATLVVNGANQTTAVDGTCADCDGIKLRNIQVNGARLGAPAVEGGGANIEMGGSNANQLIEYVHSYDPRGWSCLHVAQGDLSCTNVTVQNNDIGPAGSEAFQQWADGISVACRNCVVKNNMINNPTDGGIVLFGSPGTRVQNNTIWVETQTLLGGINLVDVDPYDGDYDGVVVTENIIAGGFASQTAVGSETKGTNTNDTVIKIGIAIGPRIWFGNQYGNNVSTGGTVENNELTGAFIYGIAMSSATNFTVENNSLVGNTSFIGVRGPNCTANDPTPSPAAFVVDLNTVSKSTTQFSFTNVSGADILTCVEPPAGGDYWPFGGIPNTTVPPVSPPTTTTTGSSQSSGAIAGIVIGTIAAVILLGVIVWFVRRWALKRAAKLHPQNSNYIRHND